MQLSQILATTIPLTTIPLTKVPGTGTTNSGQPETARTHYTSPWGRPEFLTEEENNNIIDWLAQQIDLKAIYRIHGDQFQILVRNDGTSHVTATRGLDGQITLDPPDANWDDRDREYQCEAAFYEIPCIPSERFIKSIQPKARRKIRETIRRKHPDAPRIDEGFIRRTYPGTKSISDTSERLVKLAMLKANGNTTLNQPEFTDVDSPMLNDWEEFSDCDQSSLVPDIVNVQIQKHEICTLAQHNAFMRHGQVILDASKEAPMIAMIWWNLMGSMDTPLPDPSSVPELAWTLRKAMDMGAAEWRTFMAAGPLEFQHPWQCSTQRDLDHIKAAAAAVTQANVKDHCLILVSSILDSGPQSLEFMTMKHSERTDPWKAWVWTIRQVLTDHQRDCTAPGKNEQLDLREYRHTTIEQSLCTEHADVLGDIGHAIAWHVENNQPWRNTNFRNLLRQSAQWLDDYHHYYENEELADMVYNTLREDTAGRKEPEYRQWKSLLGPQKIEDLNITPITTTEELVRIGNQMENCLPYQTDRYSKGRAHIFILHQADGKLVAAGEIYPITNGWRTGEVRGPDNSPAPQKAKTAMRTIAKMYTDAQRALPKTSQSLAE